MPSNQYGTIALGDTVNDSLGYLQTRRYSFTLDSTQTLRILMDGLTLWDAFLYIRDSSGRLITYNDDGGGNRDALIQQQFAAGTYIIEATSYRGFYSGTYALSLTSLAPPAPAINALSSTLATNTGLVSTIQPGGLTRDNTVTLSGTLAAGSTVVIYDGDTPLGNSTTGGASWQIQGSTWRFTTAALRDGAHTLRAEFSSGGAVVGTQSVTVNVDTVISGSMDASAVTDSGGAASVANGGTTSDHTLGLSGTAEAGSTVSIYDGNRQLGTATLMGGDWSFTTPELTDGRHSLSARIVDAAGNTYTSNSLVVNVTSGALTVGDAISGSLKYGQSQRYSLSLAAAHKLRIFMDGQTLADAYLNIYDANGSRIASNDNGGGNLDALIERNFEPGQYTIEATTPWWNASAGTYSLSVSDLLANVLYKTLGTDAGRTPTIVDGGTTRDATEVLSGTRAPGTTVAIFDGDTPLGRSDEGGPAWQFVDSKWSFTTPPLIGEGLHTLTARFIAADSSSAEQTVSVMLDTVAEGELSSTVLNSSAAVVGNSTTDHVLLLSGSAEAGSVVQIFDGTTPLGTGWLSGTTWVYATPILSNGDHSFTARITDPAGNSKVTSPVAVTVTGTAETTPQFSIDINYTGTDSSYLAAIQQAATRWSSIITADLPDYQGVDDLRINVSLTNLDGAGRRVSQSSVTGVRPDFGLPYEGTLELDSSDVAAFAAAGTLDDVVMNEMGHLLGFNASTFKAKGLVDPGNPFRYTGEHALAEYRKLTGTQASAIPLEQSGASGIAGEHWSEAIFGSELMTAYATSIREVPPVSRVTIGAMEDLGYSVNHAAADAYKLSWWGQYLSVMQA